MNNIQNYQQLANEILPHFNQYLDERIGRDSQPQRLREAMQYSINAGGKRLRPLLTIATAISFGKFSVESLFPVAGAVELVHTYSLIHDDLPAMDNDDLRRGKPTNHKKFDEATAILAGDGLLTLAFEWVARSEFESKKITEMVKILATSSGPSGMVAGQMMDILGEQKKLSLDDLNRLDLNKTGKLIEAAVLMGATLTNLPKPALDSLTQFALDFGLAFQIKDDILDKTSSVEQLGKAVNKDQSEHKNTYPDLFGLEEASDKLNEIIQRAEHDLIPLTSLGNIELLTSFLDYFK